jgi:hypothetical protein
MPQIVLSDAPIAKFARSRMRIDFLDSVKGRILAYRKRKKRAFEFLWSDKLQSKRSASNKASAKFQSEIIQNMLLYGHGGPYTGPLMVEIHFWAGSRNSPEVHHLAKHYLDLLQKPVPGVPIKRSKVLIRDDAQIEFLSCVYDPRMEDDGLRLRIRRLSDFVEDLELYCDIANGNLGSRFEFSDDRQHEEMRNESAIADYRGFRARYDDYVLRFGKKSTDQMDLIWRRDAQEAILAQRLLGLRTISSLLRPRFHHLRKDAMLGSILQATATMVRSVYEHPLMSVNFGARAVKKGDSQEFRERVRQGLLESRERMPLLFPLLVPCGVSVLYLPPRNASRIDLDNLVRESIIPAVHQILQPPATSRDFLMQLNSNDLDLHLSEMLERYKRAPKFHITGYQVFCLPRTSQDPENGNVRLILHGGDVWKTPGQLLDSALTEWEDEDPAD